MKKVRNLNQLALSLFSVMVMVLSLVSGTTNVFAAQTKTLSEVTYTEGTHIYNINSKSEFSNLKSSNSSVATISTVNTKTPVYKTVTVTKYKTVKVKQKYTTKVKYKSKGKTKYKKVTKYRYVNKKQAYKVKEKKIVSYKTSTSKTQLSINVKGSNHINLYFTSDGINYVLPVNANYIDIVASSYSNAIPALDNALDKHYKRINIHYTSNVSSSTVKSYITQYNKDIGTYRSHNFSQISRFTFKDNTSTSGKGYYIYYDIKYETTKSEEEAAEKKEKSVISSLKLSGSQVNKVSKINDWMMRNIDYDKYDNAYSALCRGKANCEGYAMAFYKLCEKAGIQSEIVTGYTDQGTYHAWNIVKCDGKWYNNDICWGDNGKTLVSKYVLQSKKLDRHNLESDCNYLVPSYLR